MKKLRHDVPRQGERRSEIRYFDDEFNPVARDRATWAVVRELDEKGNLVFEVEGYID
jgi:hypothetical protein